MIAVEVSRLCHRCGNNAAHQFEEPDFGETGEMVEPRIHWLCRSCARELRRVKAGATYLPPGSVPRKDFIAAMDEFWAKSGAAEICGRCHAQGTGCCPPMCRYLQPTGCSRKNVFCTGFACSALLNAISEIDAGTARILKGIKNGPGHSEFRLYEMVTRVPARDREDVRPLLLASSFPSPNALDGGAIRPGLLALAEEVLSIRRRWHVEEQRSVS